jgi:FKBP-type peptidyl-prolyl cis-trans isomerase FkpA
MTEVTRVPLQPIASGSMMKFWLGVLVGALLAGAVAWFLTREETVDVDVVTAGEGASPAEDDLAFIEYVGKLEDGTVFDQSPPRSGIPPEIDHLIPTGVPMELSTAIPGFREALMQMQKGGTYEVTIPGHLAYGATPPPGSPIPPNAELTFEVTLHDFLTPAQVQERSQQINEVLMAAQAGGEGGEGGAPAAVPAPAPVQ